LDVLFCILFSFFNLPTRFSRMLRTARRVPEEVRLNVRVVVFLAVLIGDDGGDSLISVLIQPANEPTFSFLSFHISINELTFSFLVVSSSLRDFIALRTVFSSLLVFSSSFLFFLF